MMKDLKIAGLLIIAVLTGAVAYAEPLLIDDFEEMRVTNLINGKTNVYTGDPSRAMVSIREDNIQGKVTKALMIKYDKKSKGGKYDDGGWCGYYSVLKCSYPQVCLAQGKSVVEEGETVYLDGSKYKNITFWVKGLAGNENFTLGIADEHWDLVGDSVKSQEIGKYLQAGKITTDWHKAVVPLEEFFVDIQKLSALTINFEASLFPTGEGKGTVFVDDISLE